MTRSFQPLESYSQYGEDLVAHHLLAPLAISCGRYVDIGCGHPVEFNNTCFFYRMGWRGVNVDADNSFRDLYLHARPEDVFVNAAVGTTYGALDYFRFAPYLNSTCDPARAEILMADPAVEFLGVDKVLCRPLAEILAEYGEWNSALPGVDLMSVDVEGLELDVLQSNDWGRFRPKVMAVEILGLVKTGGVLHSPAYHFLQGIGYALKAITQSTFFFVDTRLAKFSQYPELPLGHLRE